MPDTMVARSAVDPLGPSGRGVMGTARCLGSEERSISPSDDTTVTERTPGTSSTRLLSNQ